MGAVGGRRDRGGARLIIAVTLNTRLGSYPFLAPPDRAAWAQEILLTAAASQVDLVAEPGQYWRHEVDGVWVVPREVQEPTGEFSGAVVAEHQINFHPVSKDDPACFWIIAMNEPVAQLGAGFPIEGIDPITACQRANPEFPAPPRPERGPARSGRSPGVHGRSVRRHGAAPKRG